MQPSITQPLGKVNFSDYISQPNMFSFTNVVLSAQPKLL